MIATVVTIPIEVEAGDATKSEQRLDVTVHVRAEILAVGAAMHAARTWLAAHVSELLGVTTPELIVHEGLFWRFDVSFARPNEAQPGSGALYNLGQIWLEAATGEVVKGDALAAELRVHVASLAP